MKRGILILVLLLAIFVFVGLCIGRLGIGIYNLSILTGMAIHGGDVMTFLSNNKVSISVGFGVVILAIILILVLIFKTGKEGKEKERQELLNKKIEEKREKEGNKGENPLARTKIEKIDRKRESSERLETERRLEESYRLLNKGEEGLARQEYNKARELYSGLSRKDKKELYSKAIGIYNRLK